MEIGLPLRIIGRLSLKAFFEHVARKPDMWIAARADLAACFADRHPPR